MRLKILAETAMMAMAVALVVPIGVQTPVSAAGKVPKFEPDPYWPKPLPNKWMLGGNGGVFVDSHDHIWIANRPRSLQDNDKFAADIPPQADCCIPAPSIVEFDMAGNLIQAWGGPGPGYEWPDMEHDIFVDHKDNVWIGGNGGKDTQVLKFTKTGKFLLQIGKHGVTNGSNGTGRVGAVSDGVRPLRPDPAGRFAKLASCCAAARPKRSSPRIVPVDRS